MMVDTCSSFGYCAVAHLSWSLQTSLAHGRSVRHSRSHLAMPTVLDHTKRRSLQENRMNELTRMAARHIYTNRRMSRQIVPANQPQFSIQIFVPNSNLNDKTHEFQFRSFTAAFQSTIHHAYTLLQFNLVSQSRILANIPHYSPLKILRPRRITHDQF